jgi:DNA-binding transcriptional LysR family regulator
VTSPSDLRLFVAVARERSFSAGASACAVPQSTASRRIARLEQELGGRLFSRTTRVVTLTAFGSSVFAAAIALLSAEADFDERIAAARAGRLRMLLPLGIPEQTIAAVAVRARARGLQVEIDTAGVLDRRNALRTGAADAAIVPVAPDDADWCTRLGLASTDSDIGPALSLTTLRPHRDDPPETWRTIALLPDDAATEIRTRLEEHAASVGLAAAQLRTPARASEAVATALSGDGLVCCTRAEARRWGLEWQLMADLPLTRCVALRCRDDEDRARAFSTLSDDFAMLFGDDEPKSEE